MTVTAPEYYDQFHCIASACPDSCCHQWAVAVDEASAARYRALPGALGDRLRDALKEEDGDTILSLEAGRCPMWRADGLCDIQLALGEEGLCQVCRDFPRLRHDYGDFVELGLELSCPEAARLILSNVDYEMVCYCLPEGQQPEYDPEAMEILKRSQKTAVDFLRSREYDLGETLAILLLYGYEVQQELDGGEAAALNGARLLASARELAQRGNLDAVLDFYRGLEILTPAWPRRLRQARQAPEWSEPLRAMARYLVERYWLQAVSDYDLACRVKFMVVSCLTVASLEGETVETAQLYSKEIENDADNVEALLDGAYTAPALADRKLLGLLLKK